MKLTRWIWLKIISILYVINILSLLSKAHKCIYKYYNTNLISTVLSVQQCFYYRSLSGYQMTSLYSMCICWTKKEYKCHLCSSVGPGRNTNVTFAYMLSLQNVFFIKCYPVSSLYSMYIYRNKKECKHPFTHNVYTVMNISVCAPPDAFLIWGVLKVCRYQKPWIKG